MAGSSLRRRRAGSSDLATDEIDPADAPCAPPSPATGASWPYRPAEWWIPDEDDCGVAGAGAPPACRKGIRQRFQSFPPPESPPAGACLSSPEIAMRQVTSYHARCGEACVVRAGCAHAPHSSKVISFSFTVSPPAFATVRSASLISPLLSHLFPVDFYMMACGLRLYGAAAAATVKLIMGP